MHRPLYTKSFSRDFTLPTIEIWERAETINEKGWTSERQPFLPYIVFMRDQDIVEGYYDARGISWLKQVLVKEIKTRPDYLAFLESHFRDRFHYLDALRKEKKILSLSELRDFLKQLESFWPWFEGAWWLWEMEEHEREGIEIPASLRELRVLSQNEAPASDRLIETSLKALFPQFGEAATMLRTSEIQSGKVPSKSILEERQRGFILVQDELYTDRSIKEVEDVFSITLEKISVQDEVRELRGQVAQKGMAQGIVKVMRSAKESSKVREGDILVAPMTMPDFLPAMQKAAAFITDEGGIMCHASIMSRELKKPCIIGTKIATQVLKDGDLVEVDATSGKITILM